MKKTFFATLAVFTAIRLTASPVNGEGYVAHEWGTFTSVQGADGRQLEWNPLIVSELPGFVHDVLGSPAPERGKELRFLTAKTACRSLQRMETPVIYFYSKAPQTVNVEVRFPQGLVTEWYPDARPVPRLTDVRGMPQRNEIIWDQVRVLPPGDGTTLPFDQSASHYFAARNTEANSVQVTGNKGQPETEKFLFYRGVGNFRAPLTVTTTDQARELTLKNEGREPLKHLFLLQVRDGLGAFQQLELLKEGETATVRLTEPQRHKSQAELKTAIRETMEKALVAEGLYPAEARAMVATWDDSWFSESGLRVLYTLPTAWTERVLPMKLTPEPRETPVRVMVGRAEVITPAMEFSLLRELLRFHDADAAGKLDVVRAARSLGLGRFLEPAVRRVVASLPPNREFSNHAWELLEATARPGNEVAKR